VTVRCVSRINTHNKNFGFPGCLARISLPLQPNELPCHNQPLSSHYAGGTYNSHQYNPPLRTLLDLGDCNTEQLSPAPILTTWIWYQSLGMRLQQFADRGQQLFEERAYSPVHQNLLIHRCTRTCVLYPRNNVVYKPSLLNSIHQNNYVEVQITGSTRVRHYINSSLQLKQYTPLVLQSQKLAVFLIDDPRQEPEQVLPQVPQSHPH